MMYYSLSVVDLRRTEMLSPDNLKELQAAAKIIESDAAGGIQLAIRIVGEDVAIAMLVLYLRISSGSTKSWPADPLIDNRVQDLLAQANLICQPA